MGCRQAVRHGTLTPALVSSNLAIPAMRGCQFPTASENKRKTEISRDFSVFFANSFFAKNIAPKSSYFKLTGYELTNLSNQAKMNSTKYESPSHSAKKYLSFLEYLQLLHYKTQPIAFCSDSNSRKRFFLMQSKSNQSFLVRTRTHDYIVNRFSAKRKAKFNAERNDDR